MTDERTPKTDSSLPLHCQFVSFRELPGMTPLFVDYLYRFQRVRHLYADVEPRLEALMAFSSTVTRLAFPRDLLVDVLLEQNRRFGAGSETMTAIEELGHPWSVAVVTGQQPGLFTGPIYTILKALTAVSISRGLRARGISAVPVFWIEGDDHDQAEVDHCYLIDREGRRQKVSYPVDASEAGKPIGRVLLTEDIEGTIDEALGLLPPSEFMPRLERQLRDAYRPGVSLSEAFARLMAHWFQDLGLILIDPTDARLKRSLAGLFEKVIMTAADVNRWLKEQTAELAALGYHPQFRVTEESIPLFVEHNGKRIALVRRGDRFGLKSRSEVLSPETLVENVHRQPERFSPGVALRPIAQDSLLPTLVYIGGPSEIAYFGQIKRLSEWLDRPMTPILPRASATLLERRYAKALDRYGLRWIDLLAGFDRVLQSVVQHHLASETTSLFDQTERWLKDRLNEISRAVAEVDPTLGRAAKTTEEKMLYQLNNLRIRFIEARGRKEQVIYRQLQRALEALYPDGRLQERGLNILHFLSRYGLDLLPSLLNTLDVWHWEHHIVFMG